MNKKGQIFLVGAVIIVLALLTVTGKYNSVKEYPLLSDYKDQTDNYLTEYPKVVNNAIYQNLDQKNEVTSFSTIFLGQARSKDPNFGVLYSYKDNDGKIHIVNTLTNKIITITVIPSNGQINRDVTVYGNEQDSGSQVCISGIGQCTSTRTRSSDFQGSFSNDQAVSSIISNDKLKVCMDRNTDGTGKDCTALFNIANFNLVGASSSQLRPGYTVITNAQVDVNINVIS